MPSNAICLVYSLGFILIEINVQGILQFVGVLLGFLVSSYLKLLIERLPTYSHLKLRCRVKMLANFPNKCHWFVYFFYIMSLSICIAIHWSTTCWRALRSKRPWKMVAMSRVVTVTPCIQLARWIGTRSMACWTNSCHRLPAVEIDCSNIIIFFPQNALFWIYDKSLKYGYLFIF